jgi:hypothetical protein
MPEILEYIRERFDRLSEKIVDLLYDLYGYKVEAVRARVPDIRKAAAARLIRNLPPGGNCRGIH